jgi:hypothetical protein
MEWKKAEVTILSSLIQIVLFQRVFISSWCSFK